MKKVTIVFDFYSELFLNNVIFKEQNTLKYPGAQWLTNFNEEAQKLGWMVITSDIFIENPSLFPNSILISEMITPRTKKCLKRIKIPLLNVCLESPNVAWEFYGAIPKNLNPFRYVILFSGLKHKFLNNPQKFLPAYWPNAITDSSVSCDWGKRKLLVLIASNKNKYRIHEGKFFLIKKIIKMFYVILLRRMNLYLRMKDLYQLRLDAIKYFSHNINFSLYGNLWDKRHGLRKKDWNLIRSLNVKSIDDKVATLRNYKFSICFENCVFPGYITEKIFDCFSAGCIPIYLGAPDIAEVIPPDTFIDFRNFNNFLELENYITNLSYIETQKYLDAINRFIISPEFIKFTDKNFSNNILKLIQFEISKSLA